MKSGYARVWADGLIAGVIGWAVIVIFFVIFDLAVGRPWLFTAALLGEGLFYGLDDPAQFVPSRRSAIALNAVRLALYLTIGVIAAWLAALAERGPRLWYIGTVLFTFVLLHVIVGKIWLTEPVRDALPVWSVLLATLLAIAAMLAYLLRTHPRLPERRRYHE